MPRAQSRGGFDASWRRASRGPWWLYVKLRPGMLLQIRSWLTIGTSRNASPEGYDHILEDDLRGRNRRWLRTCVISRLNEAGMVVVGEVPAESWPLGDDLGEERRPLGRRGARA